MAKEKKKYTYKSKKEKEYEARLKAKEVKKDPIPELRRHIVRKLDDDTNINIYESYQDPQSSK